jgi:dGTPase
MPAIRRSRAAGATRSHRRRAAPSSSATVTALFTPLAFRRLVYKTQVFLNHEGDLFRTRLTHSLEVAQLGRSIARSLQLNEDLVEAIALAHDLGHTPFGHAGQDALNECMQGQGGFEHNLQSLRVVDTLEERYPDFDGLNLSFETREGILKHCSRSECRKARGR